MTATDPRVTGATFSGDEDPRLAFVYQEAVRASSINKASWKP
jgi:hypothetical protein